MAALRFLGPVAPVAPVVRALPSSRECPHRKHEREVDHPRNPEVRIDFDPHRDRDRDDRSEHAERAVHAPRPGKDLGSVPADEVGLTLRTLTIIWVSCSAHGIVSCVLDSKFALRTAVRTLCKFSRRTASGPEGSSAQSILCCAAGPPGRGQKRGKAPVNFEVRGQTLEATVRSSSAGPVFRRGRRPLGSNFLLLTSYLSCLLT